MTALIEKLIVLQLVKILLPSLTPFFGIRRFIILDCIMSQLNAG
jgi:hypothetical protein